jgi:hypothetical protein
MSTLSELYLPQKRYEYDSAAQLANDRALETWARENRAVLLGHGADHAIDGTDPVVFPAGKFAVASSSLTLTTSEQDVVGASVSLDKNGYWLVTASFNFENIADDGVPLLGHLNFDGVTQTAQAIHVGHANGHRTSAMQQWRLLVTAQPKTAKLRAKKMTGTGTSLCYNIHTTISAHWDGSA